MCGCTENIDKVSVYTSTNYVSCIRNENIYPKHEGK